MLGPIARILLLVLLAALLAGTVAAKSNYTVTLRNGTTFETRYPPEDAEWSDAHTMIMTDKGNWIALEKADIVETISVAEAEGIGFRVDSSTVLIGWSPNDKVVEGEDGQTELNFDVSAYQDDPAPTTFSVQQFVNPSEAGLGGGLPAYVINAPVGPSGN